MSSNVTEAKWPATIYKPCDKKCSSNRRCPQCRQFEAILKQIDLEHRSPSERQRSAVVRGR